MTFNDGDEHDFEFAYTTRDSDWSRMFARMHERLERHMFEVEDGEEQPDSNHELARFSLRWQRDETRGAIATYLAYQVEALRMVARDLEGEGKDGDCEEVDDLALMLELDQEEIERLDRDVHVPPKPFNVFADPQGRLDLGPVHPLPVERVVDFKLNKNHLTAVEHLAKRMICNMRDRCIRNPMPATITEADVLKMLRDQGMRCAVSGIPFVPGGPRGHWHRNPFQPSIDRIVNRLGYVPGNVRIVLTSVNIGINEWGLDHYQAVCHAVVRRDRDSIKEGLMAVGGWRFSTEPWTVFRAPDLSVVKDDAMISLEDAVWLPELNGQFDDRDLWRACNARRLRSSRPTGKLHFTTRAWVREWIHTECPAHNSQPVSHSSKTSGASGTASSRSALASARARAQRLKAG